MFKLAPQSTYKRKVSLEIPGDFGKVEKASFNVEFRRIKQDEAADLLDGLTNEKISDLECISDNMVGWDGIKGENDEPLEFNEENLALVMNEIYAKRAITTAFFEDILGKNALKKIS